MTQSLDLAELAAGLPVAGLGFPRVYAPEIASTNTRALELVAQGAAAGTVVLTDAQPAGRGRQGRAWVTLPGQQILLSLITYPTCAPHWLVLAAACAAVGALEAVGVPAERLGIKWPNDVLLDGRKIAGILIETTTPAPGRLAAVIGMGMNVNGSLDAWPEIATRATTVAAAIGHPLRREPIIIAFLRDLGTTLAALQAEGAAVTADLRRRWRARLVMLGQPIVVHQGATAVHGVAEDVADDGALLLRLPDGTQQMITWGDVARDA
jgi:BirA family biotin operon repressor/biotin-[acetyl-CoA-carboxylase] ligase